VLRRIDGTLFALASEICGTGVDATLAREAGRAYGLARVCLEAPAALGHGRLLLPLPASAPLPASNARVAPLLAATGARARGHLAACSAALRQLSRAARSPYLPLALVEPY
jgi:phytoene/squalene synthetase